MHAVLAAGLLLTTVGLGWVRYRTRVLRDELRTRPAPGDDPIDALRALQQETRDTLHAGAEAMDRAATAVRKGVR